MLNDEAQLRVCPQKISLPPKKKNEEALLNASPLHMFSQQKNLYCDLLKIVLRR